MFTALIALQPANNICHLAVFVYPEALVFCDACQLDVLRVELLLHDLLERP